MIRSKRDHIISIVQIVLLTTYLALILSGRYSLGLCVFVLFVIISLAQIIVLRRGIRRLDQELVEITTEINRYYQYRYLSLSKPLNMDDELKGLREDIERHKRAKDGI